METDLPPIEFKLTPQERDRAAIATVILERRRREINKADRERAERSQIANYPQLSQDE